MSGNTITIPPFIPVTESLKTIQINPSAAQNISLQLTTVPNNVNLITTYNPIGNQIYLQPTEQISLTKPVDVILPSQIAQKPQRYIQPKNNVLSRTNPPFTTQLKSKEGDEMVVYQIMYPEELNLKAVKRGRLKTKIQKKTENSEKEITQPPAKAARTRSGRIVKTPKHIEKDFEKILITNEPEVKTAKFESVKEDEQENNKNLQELEFPCKKKYISSQIRCSFCNKAYLGKRAMYQHLLKNPSHGPLPEKNNNNNFDVWNYLVDITHKSPAGQRGTKFCEELTNLLHNIQLLSSALFKTNNSSKNIVCVDKVLGNAIGLEPGKYNFDDNELYKDVTVLKLITNSQYFTPKRIETASKEQNKPATEAEQTNKENTILEESKENIKTQKENEIDKPVFVTNPVISSNESQLDKPEMPDGIFNKTLSNSSANLEKSENSNSIFDASGISCLSLSLLDTSESDETNQSKLDKKIKIPENIFENNSSSNELSLINSLSHHETEPEVKSTSFEKVVESIAHLENSSLNYNLESLEGNSSNIINSNNLEEGFSQKAVDIKSSVDLKITDDNACVSLPNKTMDNEIEADFKKIDENQLSMQSELLSDNSLLAALPNLRTSVDELMLSGVDANSTLLENSSGSDEVMNVDQFVNERFKNFTESYTDLKFNTSLNLDLPSLDLFQFHTS